jgi:hypothetical protein
VFEWHSERTSTDLISWYSRFLVLMEASALRATWTWTYWSPSRMFL